MSNCTPLVLEELVEVEFDAPEFAGCLPPFLTWALLGMPPEELAAQEALYDLPELEDDPFLGLSIHPWDMEWLEREGTPEYDAMAVRHVFWTIDCTSPRMPGVDLSVGVYPIPGNKLTKARAGFQIKIWKKVPGKPAVKLRETWIVRIEGYAKPTRWNGKLIYPTLHARKIIPIE